MISAYEQLLAPREAGARHLSLAFAQLFRGFRSVTVEQVLRNRPGIVLNSKCEGAQRGWPVHRKWMEELYELRNSYVHGESIADRTWGWESLEHLVMAALAFPLAVKLLLATEGHYDLTNHDEDMCAANRRTPGTK